MSGAESKKVQFTLLAQYCIEILKVCGKRNTRVGIKELFSFLYSNNDKTILPERRKQELKDTLLAIGELQEEDVTVPGIIALYDMVRRKFVPMDLFESVFKECISQMPEFLTIEKASAQFIRISEAYDVLKDFQSAVDSSNEAIRLKPDSAMAYNKKGIALMYLEGNNEAEAVECFDKALEIDFNLASAWMHKGNALDYLGRHKEALACYDKALEIDPNYLALLVWTNRGLCHHHMGKHEEAIACYDKALNIVNFEKGPLFTKLLEPNQREDYFSEMNMHQCNIYRLKADSLCSLEEYDEGLKYYDKALEINPNDTSAWYNKGNILRRFRKYEEAIDACQKLLNIDPGDIDVWKRKGMLHYLLGNFDEAIECYGRVLKVNSDHAETWIHKSAALIRLGRSDDAQYCLDKAKELGFNVNIDFEEANL